jgi:predicted nucleic acid-binding protein
MQKLQGRAGKRVRRQDCLPHTGPRGSIFAGTLRLAHPLRSSHVAELLPTIIAATAIEHGLTVVTRDRSDFDNARALVINPWEM